MNDTDRIIRRELIAWLQYFVIALFAAAVAENVQTRILLGYGDSVSQPNFNEINIKQMILTMWNGYYRWWLLVFVGLSALRFMIVVIFNSKKSATVEESGGAQTR